MNRLLVCIHGIRTDDRPIGWQRELDAALRLAGLGDLKRQGWRLVAPDYWDLMTSKQAPTDEPPSSTFAKPSDEEHIRDAGAYWLACSRLEAALGDHLGGGPSHLAGVPADHVAKAVVPLVFPAAREYCSSPGRRNAIQHRLLQAIPEDCELVIIGFSLGSVVAADLIYHLPRSCRVSLLVTIGSPIHLKEVSSHLRRVRSSFPFGRTGPWVNVVGKFDLVTAGRGLTATFPEVLDVFVDTGLESPHEADKVP
jgi:pimeloyl-ACP methyl ester carboxylesterase